MHSESNTPPCAPSPVVADVTWDDEVVRLGGERTGDNWPLTWADDGLLYTSYADGNGFSEGPVNYTLAFATVSGVPPDHSGRDFRSDADLPVGWGKQGIKASGLLMVGGVLYLWVRNDMVDGDWRHSRLAASTDHGRHWTWADWHFSDTFGCPEFVQYGPNYAGARDRYVYVVSQSGNSAYEFDPGVVMARVPAGQVMQRAAYQFYAGLDAGGAPTWSPDIGRRQLAFADPRGVQRIGLTYNAALGRYLLVSAHSDDQGSTHTPALGVFDAPEPWGPWTTVYYDDHWSGPAGERRWMIHHKFPTAWMSADGRTLWLAFSGEYRPGGQDYCLLARRATLTLRTEDEGRATEDE
jgi:hypothetical protein